jgi:DNA polymerase-3 subunit alpha
MQKYLRELHPTVFEDLIAMNALYRPGPMDYIPEFIKRKRDPSLIKYDIPCMEKYLKDTYGITVYQEQVMLLSRQLAGFTRGESDALRKAMGKKKKAIVDAMRPKFLKQGEAKGHDPKVLAKIWADWEKFASYAFNKSHATCYSWVAYQTAYLKAHYPAEYMAALMTRRFSQITEITKLMEECKSMGIATLGPDVNESRSEFAVNKKGEIRFGMSAIKGMGSAASNEIVAEREKEGPYRDIFDFAQRVDSASVNRKAFESLALSGGFDSFGLQREQYFGTNAKGEVFLDQLVRYGQKYQQDKKEQQNSLFGGMDDVDIAKPAVPAAEEWSTIEKLNKERDLVGIYLSAHPLDDYRVIMEDMCNTHCSEVGRDADKKALAERGELTLGGLVTNVVSRVSAKTNKPFGFVTIEDYQGSGELALFGDDWEHWQGKLLKGNPVYIIAKSLPRFRNSDLYELKIQSVEHLQDVKDHQIRSFTISFDSDAIDDTVANDIATLVDANGGSTPLFIKIRDAGSRTAVTLKSRKKTVSVGKNLVNYLRSHPEMSYHIN